jgi:hypothetical protein
MLRPSYYMAEALDPICSVVRMDSACHRSRMAKSTYSDEDLVAVRSSAGWRLETDQASHEGTLDDVAKLAHARHARGEHPGLIRQVETAVELDMLQLEKLWYAMGLPV